MPHCATPTKENKKKEPTKWFLKVSSHGTQQPEKKQTKKKSQKSGLLKVSLS
jgi:hypothetical protein